MHGPFRATGAQEKARKAGPRVLMTTDGRHVEYWGCKTQEARLKKTAQLIEEGWEVNERVDGTVPALFNLDIDTRSVAPNVLIHGCSGIRPALEGIAFPRPPDPKLWIKSVRQHLRGIADSLWDARATCDYDDPHFRSRIQAAIDVATVLPEIEWATDLPTPPAIEPRTE